MNITGQELRVLKSGEIPQSLLDKIPEDIDEMPTLRITVNLEWTPVSCSQFAGPDIDLTSYTPAEAMQIAMALDCGRGHDYVPTSTQVLRIADDWGLIDEDSITWSIT